MAKIGNISEFNIEEDDWEMYVERIKLYFVANAVKNEAKVAVFLTVMGAKAYKKIRVLCSPDTPDSKTFDQLVQIMSNNGTKPKPTQIAARFSFNNRKQQPGESVSDYHLALKELATDCGFTHLENRLRDQLVLGLSNRSTQEELLSKKDLDYNTALTSALSRECALKDSNAMNATLSTQQTNKLSSSNHSYNNKRTSKKSHKNHTTSHQNNSRYDNPKCKHCGRNNYASDKCYFKNAKCNICHQQGHIKPICPKNRRGPRIHTLDAEDEDDSDNNVDGYLHQMKVVQMHRNTSLVQPFYTTLNINGKSFEMEIDTGASVSVINKKDSKARCIKQLDPTDILLNTHTNEIVKPVGKCVVNVSHNELSANLELYVVDDASYPPLLGRPWLKELKLNWAEIFNVSTTNTTAYSLKTKYSELFDDKLRKMKNYQAK